MQFRPVVSAFFFKNCTQTHAVTYQSYNILLIIISTARGEAVLFLAVVFLAACYLYRGFECYLVKKAHGNKPVIARGEAEYNLGLL